MVWAYIVVGMSVTRAYFAPSEGLERLVEIAESFWGIGAPKSRQTHLWATDSTTDAVSNVRGLWGVDHLDDL
jgi:hypothetical protein